MTLLAGKDSEHFILHQEDPLNAEPELATLLESGWQTQEKHAYLRNHGNTPHLQKEGYKIHLDIENSLQCLFTSSAPFAKQRLSGSITLEDIFVSCEKIDVSAALQVR